MEYCKIKGHLISLSRERTQESVVIQKLMAYHTIHLWLLCYIGIQQCVERPGLFFIPACTKQR